MTKMQTTPMELNAGAQFHGKQVMTSNRKATLPVSMYHMNEHGMNISHSRTRRQRRVKSIQSMAAMDVDQPRTPQLGHAMMESVSPAPRALDSARMVQHLPLQQGWHIPGKGTFVHDDAAWTHKCEVCKEYKPMGWVSSGDVTSAWTCIQCLS